MLLWRAPRPFGGRVPSTIFFKWNDYKKGKSEANLADLVPRSGESTAVLRCGKAWEACFCGMPGKPERLERPIKHIESMVMEGTKPISMEGTRPLRGQPYPVF